MELVHRRERERERERKRKREREREKSSTVQNFGKTVVHRVYSVRK